MAVIQWHPFQKVFLKLLFLEWLAFNKIDPNFKTMSDEDLVALLWKFFGEVWTKDGKKYSKSSMVNLHSGIN